MVIDADVEVGRDTIIEPGVELLGSTRVAERCMIRTGSVITNCRVDEGALIEPHCVAIDSRIGKIRGSGRLRGCGLGRICAKARMWGILWS